MRLTPMIATSGGLMIGVAATPPRAPRLVTVMRGDAGMLGQNPDDATDEERQQRQPRAPLARTVIEVLAQGLERGHIDFLDIGKVGNAPLGFEHRLGNLPPQADDANFLDALARYGKRTGLSSLPEEQEAIEIFMEDASLR